MHRCVNPEFHPLLKQCLYRIIFLVYEEICERVLNLWNFVPNAVAGLNLKKLTALLCSHAQNAVSLSQAASNRAQARVVKVIQPTTQPFMTVISEEEQKIKTMPTIHMKCEKCDNTTGLRLAGADAGRRRSINPIHAMHKMRSHIQGILVSQLVFFESY